MLPEARAVIENAERLALSERDSLRVLALLENPPAPTDKLRRAARAFSSQVESLGGSENAIKQRLRASPVNEGERARSKVARNIT
jgi:hypothetical protein